MARHASSIGWRRWAWAGLGLAVVATLGLEVAGAADWSRLDLARWESDSTWEEAFRLAQCAGFGNVNRALYTYMGLGAVLLAMCLVRMGARSITATRVPIPWPRTAMQRATWVGILASGLTIVIPQIPAWVAMTSMALITALSIRQERLALALAVRAGRVPGWSLRPGCATDDHDETSVPVLHGFGSQLGEVLEYTPAGNYREAAITQVARLAPQRTRGVWIAASVVLGTLVLGSMAVSALWVATHWETETERVEYAHRQ